MVGRTRQFLYKPCPYGDVGQRLMAGSERLTGEGNRLTFHLRTGGLAERAPEMPPAGRGKVGGTRIAGHRRRPADTGAAQQRH